MHLGNHYPAGLTAFLLAIALLWLIPAAVTPVPPARADTSSFLRVHPDNPHYLQYGGEPFLIVTSAEHYGSVLNRDFDYRRYLDTLADDGLNMTRVFAGTYVEHPGFFGLPANDPLSPAPGRFLAPWLRSATPGYAGGGNKFDLGRFDPEFFARLKDFLRYAEAKGIVVELVLFCGAYDDNLFEIFPFHPQNNVQALGHGELAETAWYWTTDRGRNPFLDVQEALVREIVRELRDHPNVYYEIMNEPWLSSQVKANDRVGHDDIYAWQSWVVGVIVDEESSFENKHLIAEGRHATAYDFYPLHPATSIVTFHYMFFDTAYRDHPEAWHAPTEWDRWSKLGRVIVNDETGQNGPDDRPYRQEAWETVLNGGHINNLDLSFLTDDPAGSRRPTTHTGGGPELRSQLKVLKDFIHSFDFVRMAPRDDLIVAGDDPERKIRVRCFAEEGRQYAVAVLDKGGEGASGVALRIAPGEYDFSWVDTKDGSVVARGRFTQAGPEATAFDVPAYEEDIALAIRAVGLDPAS